jgi:hypothetical protein
MVFSCYSSDTVRYINKEGVELFQIGKNKTGSDTYDTVYIKDNNSVAVAVYFQLTWVVIVQLPSSGLVYLYFGQKPSHKALLQQLLRQTFECWWL